VADEHDEHREELRARLLGILGDVHRDDPDEQIRRERPHDEGNDESRSALPPGPGAEVARPCLRLRLRAHSPNSFNSFSTREVSSSTNSANSWPVSHTSVHLLRSSASFQAALSRVFWRISSSCADSSSVMPGAPSEPRQFVSVTS